MFLIYLFVVPNWLLCKRQKMVIQLSQLRKKQLQLRSIFSHFDRVKGKFYRNKFFILKKERNVQRMVKGKTNNQLIIASQIWEEEVATGNGVVNAAPDMRGKRERVIRRA